MYYKLILENGHVGAGKSLETVRYFRGGSPADMFDIAARIPRVKGKNRGTGVKLIQSISKDEYIEGIRQVAGEKYLRTRKKKSMKRKKEVLFH